jgi:hypothetical protein
MSLKEEILALIERTRTVTFVELNRISGFKGELGLVREGDDYSNIFLWSGISKEAAQAINDLQKEKKIHMVPTPSLTYLIDGKMLQLPIAKRARHYKKPHWLPVVFNPGPPPNQKGT